MTLLSDGLHELIVLRYSIIGVVMTNICPYIMYVGFKGLLFLNRLVRC